MALTLFHKPIVHSESLWAQLNPMKHSYLRCYLFVLMILCGLLNLSAGITLHEATNVTQTKATLSADFPDLNSEHGFQYKYGTLPEIDEFSKVALAPSSDPVQIITYRNAWSARTVKGWVESNSNLSVGQTSIMSANVNFSEPTTVTFEWSVDSEESIGILSFIVDGETVREISGAIDFTEVSYQATAGEHTLQWQYKKTAATNVGLDLGMIRNINLQNTTEGVWQNISISGSDGIVETLTPGADYVYRAYSGMEHSNIMTLKTKQIFIQNVNIQPTQTTVNINCSIDKGDANIKTGYALTKGEVPSDDLTLALLGNNPTTIKPTFSGRYWDCALGGVSCGNELHSGGSCSGSLQIVISIDTERIISFEWAAKSYNDLRFNFYLDGEKISWINSSSTTNFTTKNIKIPSGTHTLRWATESGLQYGMYKNMVGYLRNLDLGEGGSSTFYDDISKINITGLIPNSTYSIQCFAEYINNLTQETLSVKSDWMGFVTLNVLASVLETENVKQASATIYGHVDRGDAIIIATGLQYKDAMGSRWSDCPKDVTRTELLQNITRLKPNTTYNYRSYIQAQDCDTVFSEIGTFTTLSVEALKPTARRISQHEAELQGKVRFGDASIYQFGMQFRKSGETAWQEVEEGGNDSIYTIVKKELEMGASYQARTYIQPAGCDVIYSDILEFTTLDSYFLSCNSNEKSQTTVGFTATLSEVDEDISVERYGFEYFINSDGFFENADSYVKSEVYDVPVIPDGKELKAIITGLCPSLGIRWRAYALVAGNKVYFSGLKNNDWNYAGTDRATIRVSIGKITQTSISLKLDATQDGDAQVSRIEYALANSVQDTEVYSVCDNELTINNLVHNKQYNIRFRGTVNGRLCPLLKDISWDYSWFEYQTLPIAVEVQFSDISQTKAGMKVEIDSGDALISDLRYRIGYGEITQCQENNLLTNLVPGQTYSVTIYAKVSGKELTWNTNASDVPFKFTTKTVTSTVSISSVLQTSASVKWSSNCGDATFRSSGLEIDGTIYDSENQSVEKVINELLPGQSYSYRSFVETEEGGRVYSSSRTFTTKNIECETLPVSNISNRSATMNGMIECDPYSSAEFGFQWKQMEGWASEPVFTRGRKLDDGTISVALVNGMLEPNTDYQYRAAVRYQDKIYYAPNWVTFRTESEFVYYPASVYTILRTDRENNALVLCGYYVTGSESVVSQGYEYWQTGNSSIQTRAPQSPVIINTDESMQYEFAPGELPNGNYNVRAFVRTESGETIYGATLGFTSFSNGYSGVEDIESGLPYIVAERGVVKVYNAHQLNCIIYSVSGQILANKTISDSYDEFRLTPGKFIIVSLSNGFRKKFKI